MLTAQGEQRPHYNAWWQWFRNTDQFSIRQKKAQAELLFHRIGITFNVYGEDEGTERLIPFDSVPRIIPAGEWQRIDRGIRQRVKALNAFLYAVKLPLPLINHQSPMHYWPLIFSDITHILPRPFS